MYNKICTFHLMSNKKDIIREVSSATEQNMLNIHIFILIMDVPLVHYT